MTQYINAIRANKTNSEMVSGDSFSMYRDFLFCTLDRYGTRVDIANFDFYYREAFEKIPPMIMNVLPAKDYAPSQIRMANRRIFIPLDLV
uniref:Glycosyl transferase n=2 Tax=Strongyloides TaxID=6247 RepID=A0A0K0FDZ3_STRVS